jgi:hypothetical protein
MVEGQTHIAVCDHIVTLLHRLRDNYVTLKTLYELTREVHHRY